MEKIKIYDANMRELGLMERGKAHAEAQWHVTFHCWVINKATKSILFQLRSKDKKNFPDLFDISAAGHLVEDEDITDGTREVSEELGLNIPFEELLSLGYRIEADDEADGQKNREFQAVYMYITEKDLEEFSPQIEEVAGLMWMHIDDAFKLFGGEVESAAMRGIVYDKQSKKWNSADRYVTVSDFVPRIPNYYLSVAIMAERAIEGRFPLSIG